MTPRPLRARPVLLLAGLTAGLLAPGGPVWAQPAAAPAAAPAAFPEVLAPPVRPAAEPPPEVAGEAPPPGAPTVSGVGVRAPHGVGPELYEPLIAVRVGAVLSRREVRRSLQLLLESERFSNVSVVTREDGPGRVQVTFVLEPKRSVARLELSGATRLDQERLRRAAGLREADEFSEDRLDSAAAGIRAALARVGYGSSRVEARTAYEEQGVVVRLSVDEGPATILRDLLLVGDPGPPALGRETLTLQPGDVLDYDRLDADLERLRVHYRAEGYYRAQVGLPSIEALPANGVRVQVPVRAGPRIEFRFKGNHAFASERLRVALGYEGEELLDEEMVRELGARLERAYRLAGWYDASVRSSEHRSPDGSRTRLIFHVTEGRLLRVRSIRFEGNEKLPDAQLRQLVDDVLLAALGQRGLIQAADAAELDAVGISGRNGVRSTPTSELPPGQVYDDELYRRAVELLVERYRDEGYLDAVVSGPEVAIDEPLRTAEVAFRIHEGPRTMVKAVSFPGAAEERVSTLRLFGTIAAGRPLSEKRVDEQRLAIRAYYARTGYLYALVESRIERPEATPTEAVVWFQIREGPQVRAGRILVQGNRHTNEEVIRDTLSFREGELLGSEALASSQQRLMRLGVLRTAAIRPLDPEVPEPVKDLVVDVRERPVRDLEVGGGASIADGPRAFVEFVERNIVGRNLEFSARGKVNYQLFREEVRDLPMDEGLERQVDLGLRYPRIYGFPADVGARFDLIHERDLRPAYGLTKLSGVVGLDWPLGRAVGTSLQFELESNTITRSTQLDQLFGDLSRTDLERLRFPEGQVLLGSLRPLVTLDLRDDPASPHSGFLAKAQAEYAKDVGGDFIVDFVKLSATATGYLPVGRRTTLALSASGGKVFPLDKLSLTIPPKRFYLGGSGSLRGFSEDGVVPQDRRADLQQEIADCSALVYSAGCTTAAAFLQQGREVPSEGGEIFVLFKGELRFPLYQELTGGLFADAGNLWLDQRTFDPTKLRPTVGAGLRYGTPVGPVALDLGVNLSPDGLLNEAPFALHFSIGLF